jgi:hypothetical protein
MRCGHLFERNDDKLGLWRHDPHSLPLHAVDDVRCRRLLQRGSDRDGRQDLHAVRVGNFLGRCDQLGVRRHDPDCVPITDEHVRPGHLLRRSGHGHGRQDVHDVRCWHLLDSNDDTLNVRNNS